MTSAQLRALRTASQGHYIYTSNQFRYNAAPVPTLRSLERLGYLEQMRHDAYRITPLGAAMLAQESDRIP